MNPNQNNPTDTGSTANPTETDSTASASHQPATDTAGARGLIGLFLQHRLAAQLLVVLLVLGGLISLDRLNTQFFPSFELEIVSVRTVWVGASAEDIERSITNVLEQELKNVDRLKRMTSTSAQGVSNITLEYDAGADMAQAVNQVSDRVDQVRNRLPSQAETPIVSRIVRYEPVARLLLTGDDAATLRPLARRFERELLDAGIARVEFTGYTDDVLAVELDLLTLVQSNATLSELAALLNAQSRDIPAGNPGRGDTAEQLRTLSQARDIAALEALALRTDPASDSAGTLTLGQVADIRQTPLDGQVIMRQDGRAAIELQLLRSESGDSLRSARILDDWLEPTRASLPDGINLEVIDAFWELLYERIMLLVKNGVGGLLLVLGILFLFLHPGIALRVSLGIPIAFTAALMALWAVGGSINMISLFGFIMSLGIIVDNSIVVAEHAYARYQAGEDPREAAGRAAARMIGPVVASSLTTIAAFLPLMAVGGVIGNILFDIPLVVICVIAATLIIAFLVLPAQLRNTLSKVSEPAPKSLRGRFDRGFASLRHGRFARAVAWSTDHAGVTLALATGALILAIGLVASGRVAFTFFPSPEGTVVNAGVAFAAGTPPDVVDRYLDELESALYHTEQALGGGLVRTAVIRRGIGVDSGDGGAPRGDQYGTIQVELVSPEQRDVRNRQLLNAWQTRAPDAPGLESLTLAERQAGPPGTDLDLRITGDDPARLKRAATALVEIIDDFSGTYAVRDDTPFGRQQSIFELTPNGRAAGLTTDTLAAQLREAFDGALAQNILQGPDEIEIRLRLPDSERLRLDTLDRLPIRLPNGALAPLDTVATLTTRPGFETLRHVDAALAISVTAEVDRTQNNAQRIRNALEDGLLAEIERTYDVAIAFQGRAEDQADTFADMRTGLIVALALMFLVLAWVFQSWGWPLIVMAIIPFGLLGAFVGHWLLGVDLTILSMFGLFGLTGIVVNNSIILVSFYQQLRVDGLNLREAIIEASCQRLRAVLLTSITTIAGLTPLLFERSVQAQFLIPMAISIVFGLAVATVLVLFVIPALLRLYEERYDRGADFVKPTPTALD
ncbi:MAG: efflux RND transporter permease subunit [Thioalkalivibrionaceae bacterium]